MRRLLSPHPDYSAPAGLRIEAEAARERDRLALTYVLTGPIEGLAIPPLAAPVRTDELWRHTCFEAFVRVGDGAGYLELNFAPSAQWAAYRFIGYREGMAAADIAAPKVAVETTPDRLTLSAAVDLAPLSDFATAPWRLALTGVLEDIAGARSYWSLAHPQGRPDFHHAAGFALDL